MTSDKEQVAKGKQAPSPSEEEMAVISFLVTPNPTREESRLAVRLLLREASKEPERKP